MYIALMAGGAGSRFWPRSRQELPKQLLNLLGEKTMLQMTFDRIKDMVEAERILVITSEELRERVAEQLPQLPPENIIAEPMGRNTAPCIGLAAAIISKRASSDEVMITLPADHLIEDSAKFKKTLSAAAAIAAKNRYLVTLGVKPSYPETGYGYIQRGEAIEESDGHTAYDVKTFAEKPNLETAERFLKSGDFLWNSGMFVWSVQLILDEFAKYEPEMSEEFTRIYDVVDSPEMDKVIFEAYSRIRSVSIDYAIMEVADNVCILEADFEWNDVGSWEAAYNISDKDEQGNAIQAPYFKALESRNNFIYSNKKVVAAIGVDNMVVVETDDALLICRKDQSQRVKEIVDALRRKKKLELI